MQSNLIFEFGIFGISEKAQRTAERAQRGPRKAELR
jgi:hypothetical protein